jgi:hypothetical protein
LANRLLGHQRRRYLPQIGAFQDTLDRGLDLVLDLLLLFQPLAPGHDHQGLMVDHAIQEHWVERVERQTAQVFRQCLGGFAEFAEVDQMAFDTADDRVGHALDRRRGAAQRARAVRSDLRLSDARHREDACQQKTGTKHGAR